MKTEFRHMGTATAVATAMAILAVLAFGVARSEAYVYWADGSADQISRAENDGSGVKANFLWRTVESPPTLTIDSGPQGPTSNSFPTFGFTAQAGSTVTCSVDQGTPSFGPCSTSTTHVPGALADGVWNFRVKAVNGLGGESNLDREFTVDTVAPDTIIDSHPPALTLNQLVGFEFHSTETGSYFQCRFDDGDWLLCSSPVNTYVNEGPQVFQVRATDGAGNVDPTPASFSFTSDRTGPDATIDSGPEGTIDTDEATFTFSSGESPVQFRCRMDDGDEQDCVSPKTFTGLTNGDHVFEVYAVDQLGNPGLVSETRNFTVNKQVIVDPDPPSNAFSFGRLKLNRKQGSATLQVKTPGAGTVFLVGSPTVAPGLKTVKAKATVVIPVKAKGKAAKTLKKKGKVTLALKVRFTPTGGEVRIKTKTVKLVRSRPRK